MLMNGSRKFSRGVTLTEVLITVGILAVIFSIGPQIFIQVNRFMKINQKKIELQREARMVLSSINRNLRQASADSILIDQAANQPYCSRIRFGHADGTVYVFYQDNKKLIMQTFNPNTTQTLSQNVKYMAFVTPRSEDLTMVSVSVTLEVPIVEAKTKALHMASEKVMVMN